MPKPTSVPEVVEEIYQSILATPKRQRRLKSSTFWAKFGFGKRTKDRVESVLAALEGLGILITIQNGVFGTEEKEEWLILSYLEPELPATAPEKVDEDTLPPDDWFSLMSSRTFESEREVEYYFVLPLLEKLGYQEDDIAVGLPVQMFQGTKKIKTHADIVLFNGRGREKEAALLVVEAKNYGKALTEDHFGQVHSYSMWLTTPFSITTNGQELRLYAFRGAAQPDVLLLHCQREELKERWPELHQLVGRSAAVTYKERAMSIFTQMDRAPL